MSSMYMHTVFEFVFISLRKFCFVIVVILQFGILCDTALLCCCVVIMIKGVAYHQVFELLVATLSS